MTFSFTPIGVVRSCFTDKFGIPRQSGLAPAATAVLEFDPPFDQPDAFTGLEQCSHIWVEFVFHAFKAGAFTPRVRPPRLGGNKTLGVFATRSPNRPNRLGLSVVALDKIEITGGRVRLHISGHDLLDGTPIVDIKPYVPYADALAHATNSIAREPPPTLAVSFSEQAAGACDEHSERLSQNLGALIEQLLAQDPRPQYQTPDPARRYAMALLDLDIAWHYHSDADRLRIEVVNIVRSTET